MSVVADPPKTVIKQETTETVIVKQEPGLEHESGLPAPQSSSTGSPEASTQVNESSNTLLPDYGQKIPEQPEIKIIKKKINGYVGFANLPKQWHRRSIKNGFQLNLLCVGKQGLGKSTLINTLFNKSLFSVNNGASGDVELELAQKLENITLNDSLHNADHNQQQKQPQQGTNHVRIESVTANLEENGVTLKLCVIDTPGFGSAINNTDSWKPILQEIESRYDEYLDCENKISRNINNLDDPRVHAVLYFIEPTGHSLKPLDLEFCSKISSKCNLVPIIAKSDTMSYDEVNFFKKTISKQFADEQIEIFQPEIHNTDDDETIMYTKQLIGKFPFAVMGSTDLIEFGAGPGNSQHATKIRGRQYPWGFLEVDNPEHNDFVFLKDLIIKQHMEELKEKTDKVLYEKYRSEKLYKVGIKQDNSVFKEYDPQARQKEEKKLHEAKLNKLEAEMKQVFQQKVTEKEKKLQKSEAELFARHKEMKEKLMKQMKALEDKKYHLEMTLQSAQSSSANGTSNGASVSQSTPSKKKGFLR
ncbi:hypothetical protein ACO0RG_002397 [Hanseniaspora osmophila]|uniref:Cell division control protein 3 n=1 Tax=Hanseniaspora osmophila TaxID=56408 RepID=A0A1E5RVP3_9ASCO|nr:Cell division control protein 3 [Hanseniaspora osmophila]